MSLSSKGWSKLLASYPDPIFSEHLCMIARYGARVGYEGPSQGICRPNLVSARVAPEVIDRDLELNPQKGRVVEMRDLGQNSWCPH